MEIAIILIGGVTGLALAFLIGQYVLFPASVRRKREELKREIESTTERTKLETEKQRTEILLSARDESQRLVQEAERDVRNRKRSIEGLEAKLRKREESLSQRLESLDKKHQQLDRKIQEADAIRGDLDRALAKQREALESVAKLTTEEAQAKLLEEVEKECRLEAAQLAKRIEDETLQEASSKAKHIIVTAIQRTNCDHYSDAIISTVPLQSDDMKGRIIGREGRNIRALKMTTGVDYIIDDTPGVIILSSFDPVRREIARLTLERLLQDGRIQPARIEEIVDKVTREIEQVIWESGKDAILQIGLSGLHPELVKLLGRLKYRTSYGQNVLKHSVEVANLANAMASELGTNALWARRSGLLHDIGKAVDAEVQGPHAIIGGDLARKYGEHPSVVAGIAGHHAEAEQTVEAIIVQAADAISASRPGARGEAVSSYIQRLAQLEEIGGSFDGVEKCFAIQAGREIRVLVKPDFVDEVLSYDLCRRIAKRIEDELEYPGQIKVTVIRETRAVEFAK